MDVPGEAIPEISRDKIFFATVILNSLNPQMRPTLVKRSGYAMLTWKF